MKLEQFFKRPKTAKEINDRGISVQASRAVKDGKLSKHGGFYYRSGWFENLGDDWDTKDAFLSQALRFLRQYEIILRADLEGNPSSLRKVAAFMRKISDTLLLQADEIDRRAGLLEIEESEVSQTEAAD